MQRIISSYILFTHFARAPEVLGLQQCVEEVLVAAPVSEVVYVDNDHFKSGCAHIVRNQDRRGLRSSGS